MANYNVKVDWISFSGFTGGVQGNPPKHYYKVIAAHLISQFGEIMERIFDEPDFTHGGGQRPYSASMRTERGITIFYDHRQEWCLVQISGTGCEWLREQGLLERLIGSVQERVTRLDIAIDYETDVTPIDLVDAGISARIKTRNVQESPTGETVYLGSRTSSLMSRVYRYADPHPRSAFLRIEHEIKGDQAKFFTKILLTDGLEVCKAKLDRNRGFEHPLVELSTLDTTLVQQKGRQSEGNTIRWLYVQVVPAIAKLLQDGVIGDIDDFWEKELLPAILEKTDRE